MKSLPPQLVQVALSQVGAQLAPHGFGVELVLAGGMAGLIAGLLHDTRATFDCDVMWMSDRSKWTEVQAAAKRTAASLGLPETWLNCECTIYAWHLPLGLRERRELVGEFGPLRVSRLSRFDLIGTKLMSAPRRPQDLEDLLDFGVSAEECDRAEEHLNRLSSESLDSSAFEDQRTILSALRTLRNERHS